MICEHVHLGDRCVYRHYTRVDHNIIITSTTHVVVAPYIFLKVSVELHHLSLLSHIVTIISSRICHCWFYFFTFNQGIIVTLGTTKMKLHCFSSIRYNYVHELGVGVDLF